MEKQVKITEYSLLPRTAVPLDVRSHFKDFAEANNEIRNDSAEDTDTGTYPGIKVIATEDADNSLYPNATYYIGEIITTTNNNTYQVCNDRSFYPTISLSDFSSDVILDMEGDEGEYTYFITATVIYKGSNNLFQDNTVTQQYESNTSFANETVIFNDLTFQLKDGPISTFSVKVTCRVNSYGTKITSKNLILTDLWGNTHCWLKPFSGSGEGGGGSITINPNGGLENGTSGLGIKNLSTYLLYTAQTLTDDQKLQARTNIGAGTSNFSGSYDDLTNKPTIPAAQIQSDWNQTNTASLDYIKNKPTNLDRTVELDVRLENHSGNQITLVDNTIDVSNGLSVVLKFSTDENWYNRYITILSINGVTSPIYKYGAFEGSYTVLIGTSFTPYNSANKVVLIKYVPASNGPKWIWDAVYGPSVYNSTIYLKNENGSLSYGQFGLNQSSNQTIYLPIPTNISELTNDTGYITESLIPVINLCSDTTKTEFVLMKQKVKIRPEADFTPHYTTDGYLDLSTFKGAI